MKLTNEQLAEIRKRAEAATAGPWYVSGDSGVCTGHPGHQTISRYYGGLTNKVCSLSDGGAYIDNINEDNDATFIANARTDIPALLDMIAELQAENKLLESSFEESERNKNRYADELERKEDEDLANALEDAFGTLTDEEVEGYIKDIRKMEAIANDSGKASR